MANKKQVNYGQWLETRSQSVPRNLFNNMKLTVHEYYQQHCLLNPVLSEGLKFDFGNEASFCITRKNGESWKRIIFTLTDGIRVTHESTAACETTEWRVVTGKCFVSGKKYVFRVVVNNNGSKTTMKLDRFMKETLEPLFFDC